MPTLAHEYLTLQANPISISISIYLSSFKGTLPKLCVPSKCVVNCELFILWRNSKSVFHFQPYINARHCQESRCRSVQLLEYITDQHPFLTLFITFRFSYCINAHPSDPPPLSKFCSFFLLACCLGNPTLNLLYYYLLLV